MLSKYLVKRPGIPKTTVPHLIDCRDGIEVTLALRSAPYRLHSPSPYAVLVVIHELENLIPKEFVGPPALSTQRTRAYLGASDAS